MPARRRRPVRPPVSPSWHPFHSDPSDDLILRSSDQVLFRVSSWKISRSCTHLSEALRLARLPPGKITDVNAPARLLAMLLDSVSTAAPVKRSGEEDDISLNFDLLDLGRLYGCEAAIQRAVCNLIDPIRIGDRYWDVLIEASERDDVDVARMFWRNVTKMDLMVAHGWEWVYRLRPAWRDEIMVGLFGRDHLPLEMMKKVAEVELFLREECLDWVNGFFR